jgi:hypothetical protein
MGHAAPVRAGSDSKPDEPGWWFASDGRWYPPEAVPATGYPSASPRNRPYVRRAWVIAIVTLVAVVGVIGGGLAIYAHRYNARLDKFRHAAARVTAPPGWTAVATAEDPDTGPWCIVSCPRLEIWMLFRTTTTAESACAEVRREIETKIGPTVPDGLPGCGWTGHVPGADGRAKVWATSWSAAQMREDPQFRGDIPPDDTANFVVVTFLAGPT